MAIRGIDAASSVLAIDRIVAVSAVPWSRVCERVARLKSSKRRRSITVRPTRFALRMRRVTRSTRPTSTASTAGTVRGERPSARCDPIDRRRRPVWTGRGSRLCARACTCRPAAGPSVATSASSGKAAMSPTVCIPRACNLAAVLAPTPHTRSIGSGWRKAISSPGGTTINPSGLDTALATLARNFVRATPTLIARPTRSRTSRRRRTAISAGVPAIRRSPPTSRKASSTEIPSTKGVVSSNTSNTALLASVYADSRGDTNTASGQSRRASPPPIAPRTPRARAS